MVARLAASLLATLVVALVPAVGAASEAPAGARLAACHRSPSIDQRVAVVSTWMRPLPVGSHLAVRLDLWERRPGQRWVSRADVPGLGSWVTPSDAGVGSRSADVFKYRQAVGRLEVPAGYRFHVSFRWLDDGGAVVRESSATTRTCREPDLRPDLVLRSVTATATGTTGLVRYTLVVGNDGRSPIARAAVAATFPGEATPGSHTRVARMLIPGAAVVLRFVGPGCATGEPPASFVADPSNAVEEADETNNAVSAACPAP